MSMILKQIRTFIEGAISVEVNPMQQNGTYPVIVKDTIEGSLTSGWYLTYEPKAMDQNTRLWDGAETFRRLCIPNFSGLQGAIIGAYANFLQGQGVQQMTRRNQKVNYAVYEFEKHRFSCTQQPNSVEVTLTITDENSPFYMMSIDFAVKPNAQNPAMPYIVGTDSKLYDKNVDVYTSLNAKFAPSKKRYLTIQQNQNMNNNLPYVYAVGQPGINNTIMINADYTKFTYLQNISNEYKALAYIYEQMIMKVAFEKALPLIQQMAPVVPTPQMGGWGNMTGGWGVTPVSMPAQPALVTPTPAMNMGFGSAPAPMTMTNTQVLTQPAGPNFDQMQAPAPVISGSDEDMPF